VPALDVLLGQPAAVVGPRRPVQAPVCAYALTAPAYRLPVVSHTFHGRDVFAPAAAHLLRGVPPAAFGPPVDEIVNLTFPQPQRAGATLTGEVIYVDGFGNLVTNIAAADVPPCPRITIAGRVIEGLSPSYAAGASLLAVIGSAGWLEIAIRNGSAAQTLGVGPGATVQVVPTPESG
jgi:S-adenosylmethionine hydrolase